MADHLHKQVRDALKASLTGLTTTGSNVFANRIHVLGDGNLPALRIYDDNEDVQSLTLRQPVTHKHRYEIAIDCCAKETGDPDAKNDQISKEVGIALSSGITVGGKHLDLFYLGMQREREAAEKPVAIKRLRYMVEFHSISNAPDTAI